MPKIEIGEIKNVPYEIRHFEWRIPDILAVLESSEIYISPPFPTKGPLNWLALIYSVHGDKDISICFANHVKQDFSQEYCFGLKKPNGTVELLIGGVLEKNAPYTDWLCLIEKEELLRRMTELAPSSVLTITFTLKWTEISHSTKPNDKTKSMKLTRLEKLSDNFKDLFRNKESCDVTLKVQGRDYKAHKAVLVARSNVFAANFMHDTLERQTGVITIPDCDPDSFQIFLEFLYCGKLKVLSYLCALNLYYMSDKYNVEELQEFCIKYLIQNLTVDNLCEIAIFAHKYDETELSSAVQDFFNNNFCKVFETSEWECLMKREFNLGNKLLKGMSSKVQLMECV